MRVCPKCGYAENPNWRPARWDNPDGELEVCRLSDLDGMNPSLASKLNNNRGTVITDETFAYLLGKRATYVKRVRRSFFESGGCSAFRVPWEWSKEGIVRDASGYREKLPKKAKQTKLEMK